MRAAFLLTVAHAQVPPTDPCVQDQVRLSLGGAPGEMGVSWATSNTTTPQGYAAVVRYGPASGPGAGKLTMTSAPADSRNYSLCGVQSPSLHYARMTGLTPGAQYYYAIDGGAACGETPPALFTAPKAVGAPAAATYPFTMLAYADMGISNSQYTTQFLAERVAAKNVDVIIHAGDISYADNRGCPYYDVVQNDYYNAVSPYARHVPVMYSSGNHEASSPGTKSGSFLAYRTRVAPTMPLNATLSPFWYSFSIGRIHFVAFDIDQAYGAGSAQYAWIAADLAAVDRTATPLVVAFSHFPLLCSNKFWCNDGSGEAQAFRKLYEPLFNAPETRVHIFLNGHVHAAEINFPMATGSLVPSQTNFDSVSTVLSAMLGFPGDTEVCCNDWQKPAPAYSAWRTDDVVVSAGGGAGGCLAAGASAHCLSFRTHWPPLPPPRTLTHAPRTHAHKRGMGAPLALASSFLPRTRTFK